VGTVNGSGASGSSMTTNLSSLVGDPGMVLASPLALLSVDNNAEAAEAQPMLGLEQEGAAMNRGRAHKRPPAPQNSRAPGPPAMMFELGFSTISSRSATATAGLHNAFGSPPNG
jgi:hypothetical protein